MDCYGILGMVWVFFVVYNMKEDIDWLVEGVKCVVKMLG